jgi:hypothetical protein
MVASESAPKQRPTRPRRVYLVPPARWKSARSCAALDWSNIAPAPSSWSLRSPLGGRLTTADSRSVDWRQARAFALLLGSYAPRVTFAFRQKVRASQLWIGRRAHAARRSWDAWDQWNRRRALAAFSFCAVFGAIAVTLGAGVAHSQPEIEDHASLSKPVTPGVLAANPGAPLAAPPPVQREAVHEVESIIVLPQAAPAMRPSSPSSIALLSDVSTMDLMMPIAEPDLDIASHHSLWTLVGKEFGVDPLLLYSIALVESRSLHPGGDIGPTPWLFRVNDHLVVGERHHVQMEMAVASQLNATVQDVGIMQVYYPMHRSAVRDPLSLLDPKTNISVAAKILHDGMHETPDPVLGVGYYHSHTPQLARDYGTAVMTVYQRLKGVYRSGKNPQVIAR